MSPELQFGTPTVEHGSTPGASKADANRTYYEYVKTEGRVAVCSGDSGGAVYSSDGRDRYIRGVVSRGNMSSISFISNINDPEHLNFLMKYKDTICGLDQNAKNCR